MAQPAAWTVPLALVGDDRRLAADAGARPRRRAGRFLARLHAPETLDLDRG